MLSFTTSGDQIPSPRVEANVNLSESFKFSTTTDTKRGPVNLVFSVLPYQIFEGSTKFHVGSEFGERDRRWDGTKRHECR